MSFRDLFSPMDKARFIVWKLSGSRGGVTLKMRDGFRLAMRGRPAKDYGTAYEVFVSRHYQFDEQPHPSAGSQRIVDVGAHCGYSVLFWAARYPNARITAFEPHPAHCSQVRLHLRLNDLEDRVTLVEGAVSSVPGEALLSDAASSSSIVFRSSKPGIRVPVHDFFTVVGDEPIDILKMDIEGAEHQILGDTRFANLPVLHLAMEWHNTPEQPDGRASCRDRLAELGYQVTFCEQRTPRTGLLRAFHPARLG